MRALRLVAVLMLALPALPAADLDQELAPLFAKAPKGAEVAVAVLCIDDGRWLLRHHADRQLRLASVAKLFVSAAALAGLGSDYAFHTRLQGLGPQVDGTLPGLGVIASGSPCLDEHFSDKKPQRIFAGWAAQLRERGIERIAGDIVIDCSRFAGPIRPASYPADHRNAQQWYSAPASAFAWNDNCIEVRAVPQQAGERALVQVRPRSSRIELINKTRSVANGGNKGIVCHRAHHSNTITVSGRYSKTTEWFPLAIHEDPALLAGDELSAALSEAGIPVTGQVRLGNVRAHDGRLLLEHVDPLLPALAILNRRSQNFYGEQILRVVGYHRRGSGSIAAGTAAIEDLLSAEHGIDPEHIQLLDGSGLSYDNRSSASTVCRLLRAAVQRSDGELFLETLKPKQHAGRQARVKTGSLNVARCLAGCFAGSDERRYAFAILLNRGQAGSIAWAYRLREQLFATLIDQLAAPSSADKSK